MLFQTWIEAVSMAFGTTTEQTAILIGFLTIISLDVLVLIALGKESLKLESLTFVDLIAILLLVYMGWLPVFLGTVLALIFALVGAYVIRETIGRG